MLPSAPELGRAVVFGWVLLSSFAAAAPCERFTTGDDVDQTVSQARRAYAAQDPVALAAAVVEGRTAVQCLVEPVQPDLAEALHLAQGLWIAVEQGEDAAVPYLAAGRVVRGQRAVGLDLTDAESELIGRLGESLEAWTVAAGDPVAPPLRGRVVLDGDGDLHRLPANAPVVLQRVRGESVLATDYVPPSAEAPRYRRLRPVLSTTAALWAVGTAGLVTGAALTRAELYADHDLPLTDGQVQALADRNHGLLIGAAVTGTFTAVTAGALVLSYRF